MVPACAISILAGSTSDRLLISLQEILSAASNEFGTHSKHLRPSERQRVFLILEGVIERLEYPTPVLRGEFHDLLAKAKLAEPELASTLKQLLISGTVGYPRHVYQDALQSIEAKSPTRSSARTLYETKLINLGMISPQRLEENEHFLSKLASLAGDLPEGQEKKTLLFSLQSALQRLEVVEKRIELLFRESSGDRVSFSQTRQ